MQLHGRGNACSGRVARSVQPMEQRTDHGAKDQAAVGPFVPVVPRLYIVQLAPADDQHEYCQRQRDNITDQKRPGLLGDTHQLARIAMLDLPTDHNERDRRNHPHCQNTEKGISSLLTHQHVHDKREQPKAVHGDNDQVDTMMPVISVQISPLKKSRNTTRICRTERHYNI